MNKYTYKYKYIIDNYIFIIALVPMIISCFLNNTTITTVFPVFGTICHALEIFSIIIASIKIFFLNDYDILYKFFIFFILLLLLLTSIIGKSQDFFNCFVLVLASFSIKLENIFKIYFYLLSILFFVILFLFNIGLIPNYTYFRNGLYRQSLGMGYTTILASVVFYVLVSLVCWSFFWKNNHRLILSLLMLFISYFIYKITDTRTDFICSLLLILIFLLSKFDFTKLKSLRGLLLISPTLIFLWTLYSTYFYNPISNFWLKMNELFSERLYLGNLVASLYPAKLFGQYFVQRGNGFSTATVTNYLFLDSSFLRVYFMNGIIPFLILYLIIQYAFYKIIKSGDRLNILLLCVLLVTAFEGIFSTLFLVIGINCSLYVLNYGFFNLSEADYLNDYSKS